MQGEMGKREEILKVAEHYFLNKGFDGTSVRTIMKSVGSEIGLFYYYFKNKDEVFDLVLERFFAQYQVDFAQIVKEGRRNPCRLMENFFAYMEKETQEFRAQYAANIHKTVRWAIREHTLAIIEPYLKQIVDLQSNYYKVKPPLTNDVVALYLTHGVGSAILHEESGTYQINRAEIKKGVSLLMGMKEEEQSLRIPLLATEENIESWMELVTRMVEYFPGFEEAEYRKALKTHILNKEAWTFKDKDKIVAVVFYSKCNGEIVFLAVDEAYQRSGLAKRLLETVAAQLKVGSKLSVLTFCENDEKGKAARAFYKALGFKEGEFYTAFGYPCQKLSITVPDYPLGTISK